MKAEWQSLRRGRAGQRFQDRYVAARSAAGRQTIISRILRLGFAVVTLGIGVVLVFIPGPAILFFIISGSFFAAESRAVARFFDAMEVRIRAAWKRVDAVWTKLSPVGKVASASLMLTVLVAAGFVACQLVLA